jgi:hypothetical protein
MLKGEAHIATREHDYGTPSTIEKGKEAENLSFPLHITRIMGETMTCILKGVFKMDSCNDPKPLCKDHHCFGVFLKLFLSEVFHQTLC